MSTQGEDEGRDAPPEYALPDDLSLGFDDDAPGTTAPTSGTPNPGAPQSGPPAPRSAHVNPYLPTWQAPQAPHTPQVRQPATPQSVDPAGAQRSAPPPPLYPGRAPLWGTPGDPPAPGGADPSKRSSASNRSTRAPKRSGRAPTQPGSLTRQQASAGSTLPSGSRPGAGVVPRGAGGCVIGLVVIVAILVVVWISVAIAGRGSDDADPGPSTPPPSTAPLPTAPPGTGPTLTLASVWDSSLDPSTVINDPPSGHGLTGDPVIVTATSYVVRTGPSSWDEETADAVVALSIADGSVAWQVSLDSVVCGASAVATAEAPSGEAVACAGERGGDERLVLIDASSGDLVLDVPIDGPTESMEALPSGLVLLGRPDDDAATPVVWYALDGTQRWQIDLRELDPDLADLLDSDDGPSLWLVEWVGVGDRTLLSVGSRPYLLTPDGPGDPDSTGGCSTVVVLADGYLCDGAGETVRLDAAGAQVWTSQARLVSPQLFEAPLALADDWNSDVEVISAFDTDTGTVGAQLVTTQDYAMVTGTHEVPLLVLGQSDLVIGLSPGGTEVLWSTTMPDVSGSNVEVFGDRPVVRGYDGTVTVLDAATGAQLGTILDSWDLWSVGARRALDLSADTLRLVELP